MRNGVEGRIPLFEAVTIDNTFFFYSKTEFTGTFFFGRNPIPESDNIQWINFLILRTSTLLGTGTLLKI